VITSNAIDSLRKMIRNSVQVLAFARTGRRRRAQYAARRVDARSARDSSSERRSRSREGREARGAIEQREQRGGLVEHFRHELSGRGRLAPGSRSRRGRSSRRCSPCRRGQDRMTHIHTSKFETSVGSKNPARAQRTAKAPSTAHHPAATSGPARGADASLYTKKQPTRASRLVLESF
jgi:hypothetical protein